MPFTESPRFANLSIFIKNLICLLLPCYFWRPHPVLEIGKQGFWKSGETIEVIRVIRGNHISHSDKSIRPGDTGELGEMNLPYRNRGKCRELRQRI